MIKSANESEALVSIDPIVSVRQDGDHQKTFMPLSQAPANVQDAYALSQARIAARKAEIADSIAKKKARKSANVWVQAMFSSKEPFDFPVVFGAYCRREEVEPLYDLFKAEHEQKTGDKLVINTVIGPVPPPGTRPFIS